MRWQWIMVLFVCAFSVAIAIFLFSENKVYNNVHFINDEKKVIEMYKSTVPLKIVFGLKYLPNVEITNPDLLFKIWSKIRNLPTFDYVKSDREDEEIVFTGKVYFLNKESENVRLSADLRIGNKLYGMENSDVVEYLRALIKERLFSTKNLSKALKSFKDHVYESVNGKVIKMENISFPASLISNSFCVKNSSEISAALTNFRKPSFKIEILEDKHEFLRIELLNGKYYSVYYKGFFVELLKKQVHVR